MEDGVLTDAQGRKTDFKNTVIIMTTNIGATDIMNKKTVGFDSENREESLEKSINAELKKTLRPEFVNRVDNIVVFNSLSKEDIKEICRKMLSKLSERLKNTDVLVGFDDSVVLHLAQISYDPKYGARFLRRNVQGTVEDYVADAILKGEIKKNTEYEIAYDEKLKIKQLIKA